MTNISKENEFSPNKLLNGSEIQFYPNVKNINNISISQEYKSSIPTQINTDKDKSKNKLKKTTTKVMRPELDFLKITKIKLKTIKEIITTKLDKAFKELNITIKNKKILSSLDLMKSIEDIKWKLIEEINDLEILNKDYEKKLNNILNNHKVTQRNHSHFNNNNTNTNISSFSNPNKRNSFSDNILPNANTSLNNINDKKILSTIIHINKTPKINDGKKQSKIPCINRSKSGTKINLNKSVNNKAYNDIKLILSNNNKTNTNTFHDYIKNKKNKNSFSSNSNFDESLYENNAINSSKNKIEEKEKELNYIKEKLENEKILNKNLLQELDQIKYNKNVQKTKNQFNQIMNKNNTKNDELLSITNKLTKLIEMVINFSYSMAHLRGNIFTKEKKKTNETIRTYENLNNNLKQIYNEFEIISKNLKNAAGLTIKSKNTSQNKNNVNNISLESNKNNSIHNNSINNNSIIDNKKIVNTNNIINDNINIINNSNHKNDEKYNQDSLKIYNSSNKFKEITINSPIKEENSLEITNEEKINIEEIKKNLNNYAIKNINKEGNDNNNINNMNKKENYQQINIIQNKNRYKKDESEDNDFEKTRKSSLNFFIHTNSDKVFTFRNNSLVSNKEGDRLTEKSGGGAEGGKPVPADINKIIEENHNLKMQLASEMLKNNGMFNTEKSESHNDEEYEEIISGLKKKLEEKDNKIKELEKKINSESNNINNDSFKNKMNSSMNEMEKIKGNYKENISTIQDIYESMLIEKENKIKELTNEVNIIEKEIEELNDKYDKEKEKTKLNTIKINGLENEKMSLLEQIKELKMNYEKSIESLKKENSAIKSQLNNSMKEYMNNHQNNNNINVNDNNFNSASNRQINKQKEELILLKKKFKEILDDNNKLTNEVNDYNLNQIKEKEEFINMMRNTFTKFLKASKIDNKNKEYAIIVLKLLGYNDNDIKDIFQSNKKGLIFGIFQ